MPIKQLTKGQPLQAPINTPKQGTEHGYQLQIPVLVGY